MSTQQVRKEPIVRGTLRFLPVSVTFLLALVMLLPIGTEADGTLMPNLVLISVFYWTSHRAILIPYGAVASIGFFLDLWLGLPLGLNMFQLVLTRFLVLSQLKHLRGRSTLIFWIAFTITAAIIYAASWALVSIIFVRFQPITPVIVSWIITSFAYTPFALFLRRLRRSMS